MISIGTSISVYQSVPLVPAAVAYPALVIRYTCRYVMNFPRPALWARLRHPCTPNGCRRVVVRHERHGAITKNATLIPITRARIAVHFKNRTSSRILGHISGATVSTTSHRPASINTYMTKRRDTQSAVAARFDAFAHRIRRVFKIATILSVT